MASKEALSSSFRNPNLILQVHDPKMQFLKTISGYTYFLNYVVFKCLLKSDLRYTTLFVSPTTAEVWKINIKICFFHLQNQDFTELVNVIRFNEDI